MQFIQNALQYFSIFFDFRKLSTCILYSYNCYLFVMTVLKGEFHIAFRLSTLYFRYINESSPLRRIH